MHEDLKKHKVQVIVSNKPIIAKKVRPNDPCWCGSGKKAKHCHGTETKYYKSK